MNNTPIQITYRGLNPYAECAVQKANQLLRQEHFYAQIAQLPDFYLANISPAEISSLMRKAGLKMEVELYYALSPLSNVGGYDDEEHPNIIHLNIWQLSRPTANICNSLIHSCVHAVNSRFPQWSFGHTNCEAELMEYTAPYKIGGLAQHLVLSRQSWSPGLKQDATLPRHSLDTNLALA